MYAAPGLSGAEHRQLLQGRELRRPGRAGGAHLRPARRGDRGPRQGLRRAARLRHHARRHALRRGLRGRRGPALLHGRAAPRRARPALGLRRRREQGDGQGGVGVVALHRGRPPEAGRPDGRPLRTRGRRAPARRGDYVAGINQYIAEARLDPTQAAGRVRGRRQDARGLEGHRRDRHRRAGRRDLRQGRRQRGGERRGAHAPRASASGPSIGTQVWNDFRRNEDPEAPTTVRGTSFPYQTDGNPNPAAVAMPDAGSLVDVDGAPPSDRGALRRASSRRSGCCRANSNALLVSRADRPAAARSR